METGNKKQFKHSRKKKIPESKKCNMRLVVTTVEFLSRLYQYTADDHRYVPLCLWVSAPQREDRRVGCKDRWEGNQAADGSRGRASRHMCRSHSPASPCA